MAASSHRGRIAPPQLTGCGRVGSEWIVPNSRIGSGRTVSSSGAATARSGAISVSACSAGPR